MFRESELTRNQLDIWSKVTLRSSWNLCLSWPVINMLVSSANNMGVALLKMALGKSLIYKRNSRGPNTDPWGIRVLSCNCVTIAVYCVIDLLLIGNCHEDRIVFNALMQGTVNTGLYRISNLRWEFIIFQHSKWISWLQGIVKRWVMKVCTGLVWLMIRYGSGFCKRGNFL